MSEGASTAPKEEVEVKSIDSKPSKEAAEGTDSDSNSNPSEEDTDDPKKRLEKRIHFLETLQGTFITPLLDDEIKRLIALHRAILESPDTKLIEGLDEQFDQVESHWSRVNKSAAHVVELLDVMRAIENLLGPIIWGSYTVHNARLRSKILGRYRWLAKRGPPPQKSVEMFRQAVDEMRLDPDHVSRRVRIYRNETAPETYETEDLIKSKDWKGLASLIIKDRQVADRLLAHAPFYHDSPLKKLCYTNPETIRTFKVKYFDNLESVESFSLSKFAQKLDQDQPAEMAETSKKDGDEPDRFAARFLQAIPKRLKHLRAGKSADAIMSLRYNSSVTLVGDKDRHDFGSVSEKALG